MARYWWTEEEEAEIVLSFINHLAIRLAETQPLSLVGKNFKIFFLKKLVPLVCVLFDDLSVRVMLCFAFWKQLQHSSMHSFSRFESVLDDEKHFKYRTTWKDTNFFTQTLS